MYNTNINNKSKDLILKLEIILCYIHLIKNFLKERSSHFVCHMSEVHEGKFEVYINFEQFV